MKQTIICANIAEPDPSNIGCKYLFIYIYVGFFPILFDKGHEITLSNLKTKRVKTKISFSLVELKIVDGKNPYYMQFFCIGGFFPQVTHPQKGKKTLVKTNYITSSLL